MKPVPTPAEIGLPEKFAAWRPSQEQALDILQNSSQRVTALCSPTGSGKSAYVVADAILSNKPTCIVTATKGLQDQYLRDFKTIGMVDLRGRKNYTCTLKEGYTCEDGYVARCPYRGSVVCPSSKAEMAASTSKLVVTNYSKWMTNKCGIGTGLAHIKRVVFDEAHNCPGAIADEMQVILRAAEIEDDLKIPLLDGADAESMEQWKLWALAAKGIAEQAMIDIQVRIARSNDPKPAWVRRYTHLRFLMRRLAILSTCKANNWIVERIHDGYQFDPIMPGVYGESALFLRLPRIVMVSATLRPKTLFMSGIRRGDFLFHEFDSEFNPARCPIYYVPVMRVDRKSPDLGLLWAMLDQFAARRRGYKGIVHTVSYDRQMEVTQRSRFRESMIINPRGTPATKTVERFKDAPPGTILVSPSVGEGYDFPDDYCRWQFVCKIPFEPPSRIVKAREARDPEYRAYQAIQTLVQEFGRGMRHDKDWCENVIGDQHLEWFLPRYGHLAPRSFHGFFKRVTVVPQPLQP